MNSPSMPHLVDGPPAFIPPPQGATYGGQPGSYNTGGGQGFGQPSPSAWPTNPPSLYPTWPMSPNNNSGNPPPSASSWTYGGYTPWAPPPAAAQPSPVWGQTQATSWSAPTPGATWSVPSPSGSWGPQTPAAYSPWVPPQQQPPQVGTWFTPNMTKQSLPHTSGELSSEQPPVAAGWFGAGESGGSAGHTGYPEVGWAQAIQATPPRKRTNSIKRPQSRHEPTRKATALQRSSSWGAAEGVAHGFGGSYGGAGYSTGYPYASNVPPYARGDLFDERNLARRPLDWRPDYKPSLTSYIPGLGKSKTDVADWVDPARRHFHPLLLYSQAAPPVYHNLLETPFHTSSVEFMNLARPHNDIDFAQLACQPSAPFLRLYHPRLPWYIDIRQVHPNGITVLDVLTQMHAQLHTPIHGRHFYNEALTDTERTEITRAFQSRCRLDQALTSKGVIQLDFLGKRVIFEGVVRGPRGLWEIKLSKEQM